MELSVGHALRIVYDKFKTHAVMFGSLHGEAEHCKLIQECLKMNVPLIIKSVHLCRRSTLYHVWQNNLHCTAYESKKFCYTISG